MSETQKPLSLTCDTLGLCGLNQGNFISALVAALAAFFSLGGNAGAATHPVGGTGTSGSPPALSITLVTKLKEQVKQLEYSDKVADDFVKMLGDWKNSKGRPLLASWFQTLEEAGAKKKAGKITLAKFAKVENGVINELVQKLTTEYVYKDGSFELTDVIEKKQAQCLSFSMLVYILGNSLGLKVVALDVDVKELRAVALTDSLRRQGHVAPLVLLADNTSVIAEASLIFVSRPFGLEVAYAPMGNYWELKDLDGPWVHGRFRKGSLPAWLHNNRGFVASRLGPSAEAIASYTKAIELDPQFSGAYWNRGSDYGRLGRSTEAIADYTRAIELNPKCAAVYHSRGKAYDKLGRRAEAIADYTKAIDLDAKEPEAHFDRGLAYDELGQQAEALADDTKAIALDPKDTIAYYNRGVVYGKLGRTTEAISDYTKAIELNPQLTIGYYNRGAAFGKSGRWEEAITDYSKAIELDPKHARAYYGRGNAYWKLGHLAETIADCTKAIELDPKLTSAYYNRGAAFGKSGRWEEAITDYSKAIELDPKHARAYYNRGNAYWKLGHLAETIADCTKAIELDQKYCLAYYNRGAAFRKSGRLKDAKDDFAQALKLTADENLKAQISEALRQLDEPLKTP